MKKNYFKKVFAPLIISFLFLVSMSNAGYAETTVPAEVGFIFNTFLFLVCGFLVMFMAAGFTMLESGWLHRKVYQLFVLKTLDCSL